MSVLKISKIGFFCVFGMSNEELDQIRCKKTSKLIKHVVKINDLYWIGLQLQISLTKNILTSTVSELTQWMIEAASLAVAPINKVGFFFSDLAFNLFGGS